MCAGKLKKDVILHAKGTPFIGIWMQGSDVRISFGLKTHIRNRNIHLTIFYNNDDKTLNTHITDSGKIPKKVWEREVHVDELMPIANEFIKESLKRYYWFNYYWRFSIELRAAFGFSVERRDIYENGLDITNILETLLKEDALVRTRIRKEYFKNKIQPGFQFKHNDTYLIAPVNSKFMIKINTDIRKTPLMRFPTVEGLFRYFDYLEEEHILEQMKDLSEEKMQKVKNIILGSLAEAGIQLETSAPSR